VSIKRDGFTEAANPEVSFLTVSVYVNILTHIGFVLFQITEEIDMYTVSSFMDALILVAFVFFVITILFVGPLTAKIMGKYGMVVGALVAITYGYLFILTIGEFCARHTACTLT